MNLPIFQAYSRDSKHLVQLPLYCQGNSAIINVDYDPVTQDLLYSNKTEVNPSSSSSSSSNTANNSGNYGDNNNNYGNHMTYIALFITSHSFFFSTLLMWTDLIS